MIPAATQTLAKILAGGTSLLSTEQIDFNHPSVPQDTSPRLNLYCYNIQENSGESVSSQLNHSPDKSSNPKWFDVFFLVSAWDCTSLGEQHLLSEALLLLLHHRRLGEEVLAPTLRGYGQLPMTVCTVHPSDAAVLWSALGVPLRAALYVKVTIPIHMLSDAWTDEDTAWNIH